VQSNRKKKKNPPEIAQHENFHLTKTRELKITQHDCNFIYQKNDATKSAAHMPVNYEKYLFSLLIFD